MPKSQISPVTGFAKLLTTNMLQFSRKPEKSVKICQNLSKSVHCADLRRRTYPFHSFRSLLPLRSLPVNGPALDGREALLPLRVFHRELSSPSNANNRKNEKQPAQSISHKKHRFCEKIASRFRDNILSINYLQKSRKFIFSHFFALFRTFCEKSASSSQPELFGEVLFFTYYYLDNSTYYHVI